MVEKVVTTRTLGSGTEYAGCDIELSIAASVLLVDVEILAVSTGMTKFGVADVKMPTAAETEPLTSSE